MKFLDLYVVMDPHTRSSTTLMVVTTMMRVMVGTGSVFYVVFLHIMSMSYVMCIAVRSPSTWIYTSQFRIYLYRVAPTLTIWCNTTTLSLSPNTF